MLRDEDRREPSKQIGELDNWWVIKDNPVLGGTDIKNPEQSFQDGSGGPPTVTMEFSDKGRKAFARRPARSRSAARQRRSAGLRIRRTPRTTSRSGSTTS